MYIKDKYEVSNFLKALDLGILKQLLIKYHDKDILISKPVFRTFSDGSCGIVYVSCLTDYPYSYSVNVLTALDMYVDEYHTISENPAQLANPEKMFAPEYTITPEDKKKIFSYAETLSKKPSNVNEKTLNSYREMMLSINQGNLVNGKTYEQTWADRIHRDVERKYNATIEQAERERSLGIHELDKFKTAHGLENYFSDPTDTLTHIN